MNTFVQKALVACAVVMPILRSSPVLAEPAVCVRVKLVIPQRLSFERDAFDASLGLTNNLVDAPLEHLRVQVQFYDMAGNRADTQFFLTTATISALTGGIDGAGVIAAEQKGQINWLIIPTVGAGGVLPAGRQYKVKAVIDYSVQGIAANIETYEEIITVRPQPELRLDYFLPRHVYGDDPFTADTVEPSIPFDLAVRVSNIGYGDARNLRIVSGQPRIVENDQGLLIDFAIVGTFRNDNSIERTLAIPFGTLGPGRCSVGSWAMTTSLMGEFVELSVSFEHSPELGGAKTSLVSGTRSHRLVHRMQVDTAGKDDVSDLLAWVDLDGDGVGDVLRIFESQCGETPARPALGSSSPEMPTLSIPTALVTATVSPGWSHVQAPDPSLGTLAIIRAERQSDGKVLHWRNAWQDLDDSGQPVVGLADYSGVGPRNESWLLTYDMSEYDQVAPVTTLDFLGPVVTGTSVHISPTTIMTLVATDDLSGVVRSEYRLDGGPWQPNGPFYFQTEGAHLVEFYSADRKGNAESVVQVTVLVDGSAPVVTLVGLEAGRSYLTTESPVVSWTVSDDDSSPSVRVRVLASDGSVQQTLIRGAALDLSGWALGSYTVEVEASDRLGNSMRESMPFLVQSEVGGCVNVVEGGACDDGDPCTVGDTCQSGACVGGGANSCDDGNVCTNDSCDSSQGCVHSFNTLPCDDGSLCTSGDQCDGQGQCVGSVINCDDGNVCTDESCDSILGCVVSNNTAPCDDGKACTSGDVCSGGVCTSTPVATGTSCDDQDACTQGDQCDGTGLCAGATRSCDDGEVCTQDSCDSATGCVHTPVELSCDDGKACTVDDLCSGGLCAGRPLEPGSVCDDGDPCTGPDRCDEQVRCLGTLVVCDQGVCDPGLCCGGDTVACDDGDPCTADLCESSGSACHHVTIPGCGEDGGLADGSLAEDAAVVDAAVVSDASMGGDVSPTADAAAADVVAVDTGSVDARVMGGVDAGEPVGGDNCGCTSASNAAQPTLALWMLLSLLVWRRRRAQRMS